MMFLLSYFCVILSIGVMISYAQILWNRRSFSTAEEIEERRKKTDSADMITMTVFPKTACVYDNLYIQWNAKKSSNFNDGVLVLSSFEKKDAFVTPILSTLKPDHSKVTENRLNTVAPQGIIRCAINEQHCVPKSSNIIIERDLKRIVIVFKQDTNQPALKSSWHILSALEVTPPLFGDMTAKWLDPQRLEIGIGVDYIDVILARHRKGERILALVRETEFLDDALLAASNARVQGSVAVRLSEFGEIYVYAADRTSLAPLSKVHTVQVKACQESPVLPSFQRQLTAEEVEQESVLGFPQAAVRYKGVLSVSGKDPIRLSNEAVPSLVNGSWSLSFWMRLLEKPTGKFRAVFYRGGLPNGWAHWESKQRTPSAWLMANTNRLLIRASSATNEDQGAETINEIPMDEWCHLTFVFRNTSNPSLTGKTPLFSHTKTSGNVSVEVDKDPFREEARGDKEVGKGFNYSIEVFLNGKLDVKIQFPELIISNPGMLHIFKDPSFVGPKSFVHDLIVWDKPLDAEQVKSIYSNGLSPATSPVDTILDLFQDAKNPLIPYLAQDKTQFMADPLTQNTKALLGREGKLGGPGEGFLEEVGERSVGENRLLLGLLMDKAKEALKGCESFESRLDLFAEAAELSGPNNHLGGEALKQWASLLMFGIEKPNANCGVAGSNAGGPGEEFAAEKAVLALLQAVELGSADSLIPLALTILSGVGINPLLHPEVRFSTKLGVPLHSSFVESEGGKEGFYRLARVHRVLGEYLKQSLIDCDDRNATRAKKSSRQFGLSRSVLCPQGVSPLRRSTQQQQFGLNTKTLAAFPAASDGISVAVTDSNGGADPTELALGLMYLAAVHGVGEAHIALAHRYELGVGGVAQDTETAGQYLRRATVEAYDVFHSTGGQPILENDRINDKTAPLVSQGNSGNNDELIQNQIIRAKEGHIPSMVAMGDLYYFGARGLPRDQTRALEYYEQAANLGDASAKVGAANMYLKGEGTEKNTTKALQIYEEAVAMNFSRALNGLGVVYFSGQLVPKDQTRAFHLFLEAAKLEKDSDSLFNTGYCWEQGLGTPGGKMNMTEAADFYLKGAKKFGNFDAIQSLGKMFLEGRGVRRNARDGVAYLNSASAVGPWGGWLRRGLDLYLSGNYDKSLNCYLRAGELGYEVSQSNAAYVLSRKLLDTDSLKTLTESYGTGFHYNPNGFLLAGPTDKKSGSSQVGFKNPGNSEFSLSNLETCVNDGFGSCDVKMEKNKKIRDTASSQRGLRDRLQSRLFASSAARDNKDNIMELGNCYFWGKCGLRKDQKMALHLYSKASQMGQPLASLYLAVIHHFGIGDQPVNPQRAHRYYSLALESDKLETQLQYLARGLRYLQGWVGYPGMGLLDWGLQVVVRRLWDV